MGLKDELRECALQLGFVDAGFTTVEPLELYIQEIESRPPEMYGWVTGERFNLLKGAAPGVKHPWARSIMVLIRNYHRRAFPPSLLGVIGRCYQVDERKEKGREHQRLVSFLSFVKEKGIRCLFDGELPARMAAARAGLVTYGQNCFAYASRGMQGASWLESIPLLLDRELPPDEPSIELGCPPDCKQACLAACPTGALYEPLKMNPRLCIAYNSYYGGESITPRHLREPMGTWVYGCDRCQEVCPRNRPWLKQELPPNRPLLARAGDFDLAVLLAMGQEHYEEKVWPLCFYISRQEAAKWRMNAARALGNLGSPEHLPALKRALSGDPHDNVRGMAAWALGRLGGASARRALESRLGQESDLVAKEIRAALDATG